MCGINLAFSEDPAIIQKMAAMTRHRGIRDKIVDYGGRIWVGHNRLPIQGTGIEHDHPASYKNWDGFMVGEIFNFKDLDPVEKSDLPIVLRTWMNNGLDGFRWFDGFWACVFVERTNSSVYVVTDPLAKKPLYSRSYPEVRFSSELWPLVLPTDTLDMVYRSAVMKWGYCPENRTPFNEIKKMPPGLCLRLNARGEMVSSTEYGGAFFKPDPGSSLIDLLYAAVRLRTVSDVPVSILLSGGLDSSILFQLLRTFTHDFTVFHADNGEEEFLNDLRIPSNIRVKKIPVTAGLESAFLANQSPVDMGSVLPQFALGTAIRDAGFHVTISGDGADELFGGYRRSAEYDSQYSDVFHELVFYHLPRLDFLMMASTVELRCPYLSWPVIRKALSVPWHIRRHKEILKSEFINLIPKQILERTKTPLRIPGYAEDRMRWRGTAMKTFDKILEGRFKDERERCGVGGS